MDRVIAKQLYARLIRESAAHHRDEKELLLWMLLLLTHEVVLREAVMEDFPGHLTMPFVTQRTAAEILSVVWPQQESGRSPNDWYRRFQLDIGEPKKAETSRKASLEELASRLRGSPLVDHVRSRGDA